MCPVLLLATIMISGPRTLGSRLSQLSAAGVLLSSGHATAYSRIFSQVPWILRRIIYDHDDVICRCSRPSSSPCQLPCIDILLACLLKYCEQYQRDIFITYSSPLFGYDGCSSKSRLCDSQIDCEHLDTPVYVYIGTLH